MASRTTPTAATSEAGPATNSTRRGGHPAGTAEQTTIAPPPKLRRRPMLMNVLAVALIALGGLAAAWLTTVVGDTQPVLALRADIERGTVIERGDLTVAQVNTDPALSPVPEQQRDKIVGKRAAVDLAAGSILTPDSVTDKITPAAGESLAGVTLTRGQLPARALRPGDNVRIVDTPRTQDDPPTGEPATIAATVVGTRELPDAGQVVVDVTVPTRDAADLAARVATGRVALVLDGGGGS